MPLPDPFFIILLVVPAALGIYYIQEKKRSSSLRELAREMHLDFSEDAEEDFIDNAGQYPLLNKGHSRKVINRMSGLDNPGEPVIFGYKYTQGSGKNSSTYSQTVAWVRNRKTLPLFQLYPENYFHRFVDLFNKKDIDIEQSPVFSRMYVLKSEHPSGISEGSPIEEVRMLFSHLITNYFETHRGLHIECTPSGMLIYFKNRRLKPDDIPRFYQQARNIYSLFNAGHTISDHDAAVKLGTRTGRNVLLASIMVLAPVIFVLSLGDRKFLHFDSLGKNRESLFMQGWRAFEKENYVKAVKLYSEHLDSNPADAQAYFYRGLAYGKQLEYEKALRNYQSSVKLDPDFFDAYLHIDYLLAREKRFPEIVDYWTSYIEKGGKDPRAYLERGGAYLHGGDQAAALADARYACDQGVKKACDVLQRF